MIPAARTRLVSLDAFRGAVMALMVVVNTPGDGRHVYAPLEHAEWHGWTPTDVVFPSFLWIVGVAMTISMARRIAAGVPRRELFPQALRRATILYVLGLLVYAFPLDFSTQRLLGVLQRIAICYLVASAIYLTTSLRGQIAWIVALLAGYWLIMKLVPVPGYGAGRLDVEGNVAHWIDRIVLGRHNYAHTKTWDPEGIVSTLPAIATTLLGIVCGHLLQSERPLAERVRRMVATGAVLLAAGMLCDVWLPINKKLWTTSFALFMAGLDFVLLAAMVWWCDLRGWRRSVQPLVILGMNAIAVYLASEGLDEVMGFVAVAPGVNLHQWIHGAVFQPLASPNNASLLFALAYVGVMYLIAWVMYRRGWFLRV